MSYARRTDANQSEIFEALRRCGWYLCDTSRVPGFFDAIGARRGRVVFIEIKDGSKPPSQRQLTPAEVEIHKDFRRAGAAVVVLATVEQALQL